MLEQIHGTTLTSDMKRFPKLIKQQFTFKKTKLLPLGQENIHVTQNYFNSNKSQ